MRDAKGESYLAALCGLTIILVMVVSLGMALTHGFRLFGLMRARTELLNRGQMEMEWIRGFSMDQLAGYTFQAPGMAGEVLVELLSPLRKRVAVVLRHSRDASHPLVLVTDVASSGQP